MSEIIEIITFFSMCLGSIFTILENTMLGNTSMLSIICGMGYISITLWGIFVLLNSGENTENDV